MSANESRPVTSEAASKAVEQTSTSVPVDAGHWYWLGVEHERWRVAEAWTELDEAWRPIGPQLHADRVQARRDLFRQCAEKVAETLGRTYVDYTGGPVHWDTGRPMTFVERVRAHYGDERQRVAA